MTHQFQPARPQIQNGFNLLDWTSADEQGITEADANLTFLKKTNVSQTCASGINWSANQTFAGITCTSASISGNAVATQTFVNSAVNSLIDAAPGALDTLNELAAALGDDANFAGTVTNALATKAPIASPSFTGTVSGVTASMVGLGNCNNTSDLSKPLQTICTLDTVYANNASKTINIASAKPILLKASGPTNVLEVKDALNNLKVSITDAGVLICSSITNPAFTGATNAHGSIICAPYVAGIPNTSGQRFLTITGNYVFGQGGVDFWCNYYNSNVGTAFAFRQIISNAASSALLFDIRKNGDAALIGCLTCPSITLGASDLQGLLNLKADAYNAAFTGTTTGITKTMVGLEFAENTTDLNKVVSTATTTQLNLKANALNPTLTGKTTMTGEVVLGTSSAVPAASAGSQFGSIVGNVTAGNGDLTFYNTFVSGSGHAFIFRQLTGTGTFSTLMQILRTGVINMYGNLTVPSISLNGTDLQASLNLKAPLASPALTGSPTAPTVVTSDNSTAIATTAFVKSVILSDTVFQSVYDRSANALIQLSNAKGPFGLIADASVARYLETYDNIGVLTSYIDRTGIIYTRQYIDYGSADLRLSSSATHIRLGNTTVAGSSNNITIGNFACGTSTAASSVNIGSYAGNVCKIGQVNLGHHAGRNSNAVATGQYSVNIGHFASQNSPLDNCIVINASVTALNPAAPSGFYVNPLRIVKPTTYQMMAYDTVNKEIVCNNTLDIIASSVTVSNATFSGTINSITTTEFNYLDGCTTNIQTGIDTLNTKNTKITYNAGTDTTTVSSSLIAGATSVVSITTNNVSCEIDTWDTIMSIGTNFLERLLPKTNIINIGNSFLHTMNFYATRFTFSGSCKQSLCGAWLLNGSGGDFTWNPIHTSINDLSKVGKLTSGAPPTSASGTVVGTYSSIDLRGVADKYALLPNYGLIVYQTVGKTGTVYLNVRNTTETLQIYSPSGGGGDSLKLYYLTNEITED